MGDRAKGLRIPLVIDGTLLIAGIIAATLIYADVDQLKSYAEDVSESRITRMEKDIEYIKREQVKTAAEMKAMRAQLEASRSEILEAIRRLEDGD